MGGGCTRADLDAAAYIRLDDRHVRLADIRCAREESPCFTKPSTRSCRSRFNPRHRTGGGQWRHIWSSRSTLSASGVTADSHPLLSPHPVFLIHQPVHLLSFYDPPPPHQDMGTGSGGSVGTTDQGKGRVCREVRIGQTGRSRALGSERPIGTTTYRGKRFKERTSAERPIGAASFRQPSHSFTPPPPLVEVKDVWILNVLVDATRHHGKTEMAVQNSGLVVLHSRNGKGNAAKWRSANWRHQCRQRNQPWHHAKPPHPGPA